jgi:hypothetical protein
MHDTYTIQALALYTYYMITTQVLAACLLNATHALYIYYSGPVARDARVSVLRLVA